MGDNKPSIFSFFSAESRKVREVDATMDNFNPEDVVRPKRKSEVTFCGKAPSYNQ